MDTIRHKQPEGRSLWTVFMIPALFFSDFKFDLSVFPIPPILSNILLLGLGACALCFVSWNLAVNSFGAIQTSLYLYGSSGYYCYIFSYSARKHNFGSLS